MAIAAAHRLNGELVSVDSRQVYTHCDIGTNKPTAQELGGLRCWLIDVVDPGTAFTVADYQRLGMDAVGDIGDRERPGSVRRGSHGILTRRFPDRIK